MPFYDRVPDYGVTPDTAAAVAMEASFDTDDVARSRQQLSDLTLNQISELAKIFHALDKTGEGLDERTFCDGILSAALDSATRHQGHVWFNLIDTNGDLHIDWEEFTTFLLLLSASATSSAVAFGQPLGSTAAVGTLAQVRMGDSVSYSRTAGGHSTMVAAIVPYMPTERLYTAGEDGHLKAWAAGSLMPLGTPSSSVTAIYGPHPFVAAVLCGGTRHLVTLTTNRIVTLYNPEDGQLQRLLLPLHLAASGKRRAANAASQTTAKGASRAMQHSTIWVVDRTLSACTTAVLDEYSGDGLDALWIGGEDGSLSRLALGGRSFAEQLLRPDSVFGTGSIGDVKGAPPKPRGVPLMPCVVHDRVFQFGAALSEGASLCTAAEYIFPTAITALQCCKGAPGLKDVVAIGGAVGRVLIVETKDGSVLRSFNCHGHSRITSLCWSRKESLLLSGGEDGNVFSWTMRSTPPSSFVHSDYPVAAIVASDFDGLAFILFRNKSLHLVCLQNGEVSHVVTDNRTHYPLDLLSAIAVDGSSSLLYLASGCPHAWPLDRPLASVSAQVNGNKRRPLDTDIDLSVDSSQLARRAAFICVISVPSRLAIISLRATSVGVWDMSTGNADVSYDHRVKRLTSSSFSIETAEERTGAFRGSILCGDIDSTHRRLYLGSTGGVISSWSYFNAYALKYNQPKPEHFSTCGKDVSTSSDSSRSPGHEHVKSLDMLTTRVLPAVTCLTHMAVPDSRRRFLAGGLGDYFIVWEDDSSQVGTDPIVAVHHIARGSVRCITACGPKHFAIGISSGDVFMYDIVNFRLCSILPADVQAAEITLRGPKPKTRSKKKQTPAVASPTVAISPTDPKEVCNAPVFEVEQIALMPQKGVIIVVSGHSFIHFWRLQIEKLVVRYDGTSLESEPVLLDAAGMSAIKSAQRPLVWGHVCPPDKCAPSFISCATNQSESLVVAGDMAGCIHLLDVTGIHATNTTEIRRPVTCLMIMRAHDYPCKSVVLVDAHRIVAYCKSMMEGQSPVSGMRNKSFCAPVASFPPGHIVDSLIVSVAAEEDSVRVHTVRGAWLGDLGTHQWKIHEPATWMVPKVDTTSSLILPPGCSIDTSRDSMFGSSFGHELGSVKSTIRSVVNANSGIKTMQRLASQNFAPRLAPSLSRMQFSVTQSSSGGVRLEAIPDDIPSSPRRAVVTEADMCSSADDSCHSSDNSDDAGDDDDVEPPIALRAAALRHHNHHHHHHNHHHRAQHDTEEVFSPENFLSAPMHPSNASSAFRLSPVVNIPQMEVNAGDLYLNVSNVSSGGITPRSPPPVTNRQSGANSFEPPVVRRLEHCELQLVRDSTIRALEKPQPEVPDVQSKTPEEGLSPPSQYSDPLFLVIPEEISTDAAVQKKYLDLRNMLLPSGSGSAERPIAIEGTAAQLKVVSDWYHHMEGRLHSRAGLSESLLPAHQYSAHRTEVAIPPLETARANQTVGSTLLGGHRARIFANSPVLQQQQVRNAAKEEQLKRKADEVYTMARSFRTMYPEHGAHPEQGLNGPGATAANAIGKVEHLFARGVDMLAEAADRSVPLGFLTAKPDAKGPANATNAANAASSPAETPSVSFHRNDKALSMRHLRVFPLVPLAPPAEPIAVTSRARKIISEIVQEEENGSAPRDV